MRVFGVPLAGLVERLARLSSLRIGLAVMYHGVRPRAGDPARELVPAFEARLFERQLRHLRRRYRLVLASELLDATRSRRPGERFPVAITFDDDDRAHVETTLPRLRAAGMRATFFLTGASLEGPSRFWFERLGEALEAHPDQVRALVPGSGEATIHELSEAVQRLGERERDDLSDRLAGLAAPDPPDSGLRPADVRELAGAGCEVGFHTLRHHALPTLDDDALADALTEGRERLAEAAGAVPRVIAYPFGHADARVAAAARAAGFAAGFTTARHAVLPDTDPLLLGRLVPSTSSLGHFALQLARRLVPRPGK